ncbi:MAG: YCF48-related protein, partial [Saprospiraceae bacterium]
MKLPLFSYTCIAALLCIFHPLQAQWNRQFPLPKLEDVLDIDVSADGYGFAVGANDLILRSQAGNNQWDMLPGFGEGWRFEAVDYLDGSGGSVAAAGGDGLILTIDKGNNWNAIADAPASIKAIRILSPTHIIVAATDDVSVWDNGIWTHLNVQATAALKGAFILDDQHIWAYTFTTSPTIYYTSNGGTNWNSSPTVPKIDVVSFFDAQVGIALDGRNVYKSTNGGQNWTEIAPNGLSNSANDVTFGATANVLVAATLNAKPNISTDGGMTWNAITTPLVNQRSHSVVAISDTEFWIGNDLSGVMHSIDGGMTWIETCGPTRNVIQDVYFVNRNTGFAIGQKGLLLRTTDAGAHWNDISFGTRSYLCIFGLNANDLWIGTNQRILHSVNAGDNWTETVLFPAGNINDILAISHDRILAASTTGTIYLSKNAGMTWDSVYSSGLQMRSIARIDDLHYMATGYNGAIVRSDDQGQTWHTVTIPEPSLQYEQSFFLNGEGWLITSSFKRSMWHTTNGGNTWDTLPLPLDRFWEGVYFITKDTGVIVGRTATEGRAYLTYDGGHHWQQGYITGYQLFGATGSPNPNGTAWIFGYGSDIENLLYCNTPPSIGNFVGDLSPCEKDTVLYTLASQNVDEFTWHFPPGWEILGNPNNDSLEVVIGTNSGKITVLGSNICGETGELSNNVSPKKLPVIQNIIGDNNPCLGSVINYSVLQANVTDFAWTVPGDWSIQGNSNQASIMVQVGSIDGLITVNGSNVCGTTPPEVYPVIPFPLPTISLISGDLNPCPGDTVDFFIQSEVSVVYSFASEGLDDWTLISSTSGSHIKFIAGTFPGVLHITAMNDCGLSAPLTLNLNPVFVPQVTIQNSGTQLIANINGISYQWFLNGQPLAGATNDTLTPTLNGQYTVQVTFDTGCKA